MAYLRSSVRFSLLCCLPNKPQQSHLVDHCPVCYYSCVPLNISHSVLWHTVSWAFPDAECATDTIYAMKNNVEEHRHIQHLDLQTQGNKDKPEAMRGSHTVGNYSTLPRSLKLNLESLFFTPSIQYVLYERITRIQGKEQEERKHISQQKITQ